MRFHVADADEQEATHVSIANLRSAVNRAPESGSSSSLRSRGRSVALAGAGRSIEETCTRRTVAGVEPARSTATNGLVASTEADSLMPAQLVSSVSSISDVALRLPALAPSTVAPAAAEARLSCLAKAWAVVFLAATVT